MKRRFILVGLTFLTLTNVCYAQHIGQSSTQYNGSIYHLGGNVGIGTKFPSAKLQVIGDASFNNKVFIAGGMEGLEIDVATGPSLQEINIWNSYSQTGINIDDFNFHIRTDGNRVFSILGNGNVGVGTLNPTKKLDINGDLNFTGSIYRNGQLFGWQQTGNNLYHNTGNVGIGTAAPTEKLQIEGNLKLQNACGTIQKVKGIYLGWGTSYGVQFNHGIFSTYGTSYADAITLNSYGNVRINLDSNNNGTNTFTIGNHTTNVENTLFTLLENGNIGIGTTTPSGNLDIVSSTSPILKLRTTGDGAKFTSQIEITGAAQVGNIGEINFINNAQGCNANPDAAITAYSHSTQNNADLIFYTAKDGTFAQKMVIKDGGNVGIGTSDPKLKLDVKSSAIGYPLKSGTSQSFGTYRISSTQTDVVLDFGVNGADDASSWIQATDATNLGRTYNLLINPNGGNVCIGTIESFNYKLAVNGTIGAKEVKVESISNWPDFVFKPNYILRPLSEVEQFIKTNNHLPDIPSEKDVKENGVSLGEMNAKLLQKVEELMLYLIEQNKTLQTQQEEIQLLKEEIKELMKK